MYTLQLDLKLFFCPPMEDKVEGIRLTRTLLIPFPPYNDLSICGREADNHPNPEGFPIQNVVWDMDRQRFTAETTLIEHDLPIAYIAVEIADWIGRGWRLGSFRDDFDQEDDDPEDDDDTDTATTDAEEIDSNELLPKLSPRQRPKEFNKLFHALIQVMCEAHNATDTAYAMWKTKRHFSAEEWKKDESKPAKQFKEALMEYNRMTFEQQCDWSDKICRTYPRLDSVLPRGEKTTK